MTKRHAFTLVELLVTAIILVAVSFLTLSIFSTVARVQADRRTTQTTINQLQAIADQIASEIDVLNRTFDQTNSRLKQYARVTDDYAWALAVNIPLLADSGLPTGQNTVRFYCMSDYQSPAQPGTYGRISVFSATSVTADIPFSNPLACTLASVNAAAGGTLTFTETILTDEYTNVRALTFQDVSPNVSGAGSQTQGDAMNVRLRIAASFDERMKLSDVSPADPGRAITISRTVSRVSP